MANISDTFSGMVKSLPLEAMFLAPLDAAIKAQVHSARATANYLKQIGFDEKGDAIMVRSSFMQQITDKTGETTGVVKRVVDVPLLCLIPIPALAIDEVNINFELTVTTSEASSSETAAAGSAKGKVGWGFFSASFSASMSHKSSQTRKTDTRARYEIAIKASQQPPAEGLGRMMETLLAAVNPIDKDVADKLKIPAPAEPAAA